MSVTTYDKDTRYAGRQATDPFCVPLILVTNLSGLHVHTLRPVQMGK